MGDNGLVVELANRLSGVAIISSEITDQDLKEIELESLTAYIIDYFEKEKKPGLLTRKLLDEIMKNTTEEVPIQSEVTTQIDFSPFAKVMKSRFMAKSVPIEKTSATVADFAAYFKDRFSRLRGFIENGRNSRIAGMASSIAGTEGYMIGREICISGIVYEKSITKNGHVLVTIEDETGLAKVLFPVREKGRDSVFNEAIRIVDDEVVAIRGRLSSGGKVPFIIADSLIYPDIPIRQRKRTEEDIAIAFLSDIHVGSRLFLEKQFGKFLEWINGRIDYRKDLAGKIKYISIAGDLVDGIGVYPNQESELSINDVYKQYQFLFDLLQKVPDYIHIFIMPGNHDAVQRAEPQPELPEEFLHDFRSSNIHLLSNPGYVNLDGINMLSYHGTSLDSVIQGIPGCSYSKPETAMVEILKRRHLSPIYGDNPIVPSKRDNMIIEEVPDILHMGHLHKNGVAEYHGTLVVNSGTWQARTSYQIKNGHIPTPAILPVYELKNQNLTSIDFNTIAV